MITRLRVRPLPGPARHRGVLIAGSVALPCALGRTGVRAGKREGDGATPRGVLRLRRLLYRADRMSRPRSALSAHPIRPTDAWCDDPADRRYNRPIRRPPGSAEECLWREDGLYDVVIVLGWNDGPIRRGRGSAIFLHVARPGLKPTAGCVALPLAAMRRLLPRVAAKTVLVAG